MSPYIDRLVVAALVLGGAGGEAWGAGLDCSTGNWPEQRLTAKGLAGESLLNVEQGSEFDLRIQAEQEGHLAILVEDPKGKIRVLIPRRPTSGDRVQPGSEFIYPDVASGESLIADLNVGTGLVCVVASDQPIFADMAAAQGASASLVAPEQIASLMNPPASTHVARARLRLQVRGPSLKEFVSEDEFVKFYTVGTRSVDNAGAGFRIGFELNSAQLDSFSRRQLEAVGKGMKNKELAKFQFLIEGHTDDLGTPAYNLDLSTRRAESVRDFLAGVMGVPASRLDVKGLGMSQPQVEGTSDEARSQNRRVVIRRLDDAANPH